MSQSGRPEKASTSQAGNKHAAHNEQLENIRRLIYFLIYKFEGISEADESKNNEIDLDRSNIYAGFLSIIFSHLRKISVPDVAARGKDRGDNICSYKNNSHSVSELALEFQEVCSKNGIVVVWNFKLAETLVNVLTAFKMSWDESRRCVCKFKLRGSVGQLIEKDLREFGLTEEHLPLLTGLTYTPERRPGLMRALGPLTLAIMLSAQTRNCDTIAEALRESLKDIPMGDSIVDCLRNEKGPEYCRALFTNLADLLLTIGSISFKQIFFPLLFVVKTGDVNVDFSGVKGYGFYMKHYSSFTWKKLSKGTADEVAQAVFHAMFGTPAEDLGVLNQITSQANWGTRKEIEAAYRTNEDQHVNFTPIGCKYVYVPRPKPNSQGMLISKIVFSGYRKRNYSSAFPSYSGGGYGTDVSSLSSSLLRMKHKVCSGTNEYSGKTDWMHLDGSHAYNFVALKSGKFFYK